MASIINRITHTINNNLELCLYSVQMNSYWNFLEHNIDVKRERIALGTFGFLAIYLVYGWGNDLLCNFIGFICPVYGSYVYIFIISIKYSNKGL